MFEGIRVEGQGLRIRMRFDCIPRFARHSAQRDDMPLKHKRVAFVTTRLRVSKLITLYDSRFFSFSISITSRPS